MAASEGDDFLVGTTAGDTINGLGGNDTIDAKTRPAAGPDIDVVDGGTGIDTLLVDASAETQSVTLGFGSSPTFTVRSTSGNFYVDAYNMEKINFTGGSGNDTINTAGCGGSVNGGGGIDYWIADLSNVLGNVDFSLGTTTSIAGAGLTSILGIERISMTTGDFNDFVFGGAQADTIRTGAGQDLIDAKTRPAGGSAVDVVDGGPDTDTLQIRASAETQSITLANSGAQSFTVRSVSGNFAIDADNIEQINIDCGSGNDSIDTGGRFGTFNGNGGTDYWVANLAAVTVGITFYLGTSTFIRPANLSISGFERMSLTTGSGNDVIVGGDQADTINTGYGDDAINAGTRPLGGSAIDSVNGGVGTDTLVVYAAAETKSVTLGTGTSPNVTVRSVSGNFYVDAYNIEIVKFTGGSGNDSIDTGDHGGTVNGSGGTDHWIANLAALTSGITFTLGTTTAIAAAGLTSIAGLERITLTTGSGNDVIGGGAQADTINTGNGNDTINAATRPAGGTAIDSVDGGSGTDTLIVNAAAETQSVTLGTGSSPTFTVRSTSGNFYVDAYNMEKIRIATGAGADTIDTGSHGGTVDGNGGTDHWIADVSAVTSGITFYVGASTAIAAAGLTSILHIERMTLTTGSGNDVIVGGAQADTINTGNGDDAINAGTRPSGVGAIDVVDGGFGNDLLVVGAAAETTAVQVSVGASPSFEVRSASGNFYVDAYNIERIAVYTGSGADTVTGGAGADAITTNGGDDILDGGGGIDRLIGSDGNDTLIGGSGADIMTGGAGADIFDYNRVTEYGPNNGDSDIIGDFTPGVDKIDLSDIDANNLAADGDQAFTFIGAAAFHKVAGELRSIAGQFQADTNGDGWADMWVTLSNNATAAVGDFIL